jgi:hypothetical protein
MVRRKELLSLGLSGLPSLAYGGKEAQNLSHRALKATVLRLSWRLIYSAQFFAKQLLHTRRRHSLFVLQGGSP